MSLPRSWNDIAHDDAINMPLLQSW